MQLLRCAHSYHLHEAEEQTDATAHHEQADRPIKTIILHLANEVELVPAIK